ncbi:class I SAM-dependent methyltransferase [Effusibacillus consociatus]|uniref:class I SAM-dependent methyltransferase n=1 Tax=Effusibacillus consociatus TaxID=1117041 RepID=UPI0036D30551
MYKATSTLADRASFLMKFVHSPKDIGSITPSSSFLAKAMIKPIDWEKLESVVELGAGTGVFTRYIQDRKRPSCKAVIFEQDPELRGRLKNLYPNLVFRSNAENLFSDLQELGLPEVDCILSGLPFANFSPDLREKILSEVVRSLKPGGLFIAFQYFPQLKSELKKYFPNIHFSVVPLNLPPAFVYCCTKS